MLFRYDFSVLRSDGVVEGGTGEMRKQEETAAMAQNIENDVETEETTEASTENIGEHE